MSSARRNDFFSKLSDSLRHFFNAYAGWHHYRLSLALVFSLFLHVAAYIVSAPSPGVSSGEGQSHAPQRTLYAVLKTPFTATEIDVPTAVQEVVTVEASSNLQVPPQENAPVQDVDVKKQAERSVSEPAASDTKKTSEALGPEASETNNASESSEPGLPPAPGYLYGLGLHRQPRLLNEVTVDYPTGAGAREGKVMLRILVSETGAIDNMVVVRASPAGFFEEVTLNAFARAEFAPGEFLGVPVKSQFFVEVEFVPINRGGVSGKGY